VIEYAGAPVLWGLCVAVGVAVAVGHQLAAPARRRRLAEVASAEHPDQPR
jgi:membrane glycosyltransferase